MRRSHLTIGLAIAAVVLFTGCSTSHYFRLLLTVRDADTGQPVSGAKVVLDAGSFTEEQKANLDAGYHAVGSTDVAGQFAQDVRISPYPSSQLHWWLKVQKDGYEPAVIDVKPNPQPPGKGGSEKTPLPVTVEMKPLPKEAVR